MTCIIHTNIVIPPRIRFSVFSDRGLTFNCYIEPSSYYIPSSNWWIIDDRSYQPTSRTRDASYSHSRQAHHLDSGTRNMTGHRSGPFVNWDGFQESNLPALVGQGSIISRCSASRHPPSARVGGAASDPPYDICPQGGWK